MWLILVGRFSNNCYVTIVIELLELLELVKLFFNFQYSAGVPYESRVLKFFGRHLLYPQSMNFLFIKSINPTSFKTVIKECCLNKNGQGEKSFKFDA